MGKGTVAGGHNLYLGTAALSERDYVHEAIDRADLIVAIGHDTIEKPPFLMGPDGPQVIHISFTPANVEQVYFPHAEVVGDVGPSLALLADRLEGKLHGLGPGRRCARRSWAGSADRATEEPLPADPAADRPRCPPGHAGGRHRRPRQRHVQDLVRPQLPHLDAQHAAARQRAGDDGRGAAVGDDGGDAVSRPARAWRCAATAGS